MATETPCPPMLNSYGQGILLVRQSGTTPRKRGELRDLMEKWVPDVVYAFRGADAGPLRSREGVRNIDLGDPTPDSPWGVEELRRFRDAVLEAKEFAVNGRKVLFVCVGGKNRSRAAALATLRLAASEASARGIALVSDNVKSPHDKAMQKVADLVGDPNGYESLAPLYSVPTVRKRTPGQFVSQEWTVPRK